MKASLPIGSVVLLKNAEKKIMVTGYYPKTEDDKIFDYTACLYPEGVLDSKNGLLFNHDDIAEVFFNGYVDDEQKEFMQKVNDAVKQLEQSNEVPNTTEQQVTAERPVETLDVN